MTLDELTEKTAGLSHPRLLLLAALEPPTSAGALAAAIAPAGGTAAPWDGARAASALTPEQISAFAPEVLIVAAADLDAAEAALEDDPFWASLPCAAAGDCYVADAQTLTDEPRVLATILHPEVFTELVPAFSVRIVNLG